MKTHTDSDPSPKSKDYYEENITPMEEAEVFGNGPETPERRMADGAVKGAAWLGGIFAVFAVAILIAALFGLNPKASKSPASSRTSAQTAYLSASKSEPKVVAIKSFYIVKENAGDFADKAKSAVSNSVSNASAATSAIAAQRSDATGMTKADMDRIEREAREVIHGDYGNNPGRAAKLGSDYSLVQARVNQLLHS